MKPKGKFIMIETALVRSEQLSSSEKLLYMALRTYRHNSHPIVCNPGETTLLKCTGLSKPTFLKVKKLLTFKGLIEYQPGGGRTITNRYSFPLEDGTDEEKRRLVAYLSAKKTGKKLNLIKQKKTGKKLNLIKQKETGKELNPLINQKQVKNQTTLQPNSGQKTGKKLNHEQEVSLKKQQQKNAAAVSPFISSIRKIQKVFRELKKLGIKTKKARELIRTYPLRNIENQLEWLPLRNVTYPAGALIAALKENWLKPGLVKANEVPPESKSKEYKRQYDRLKEASQHRFRLDLDRRRKGKTGKKLNPYSATGPAPHFSGGSN